MTRKAGPWLRACVAIARWRDQAAYALGTHLANAIIRLRDSGNESP